MNLNEFDKTSQIGLYISKEEHPIFGKKYIARFQHDKKRYVKVLGYVKKDNLTLQKAVSLFEDFKLKVAGNGETLLKKDDKKDKEEKVILKTTSKVSDNLQALQEENKFLKSFRFSTKLSPSLFCFLCFVDIFFFNFDEVFVCFFI